MSISRLKELITLVEMHNDEELRIKIENAIDENCDGITDTVADSIIAKVLKDRIATVLSKTIAYDTQQEQNITLQDADIAFMEDSASIARKVFENEDWHYSERVINPTIRVFEIGYGMFHANFRVQVRIDLKPKACRIQATLPIRVDSRYDYELCRRIALENNRLRYGAFMYDDTDGELSYRYTYPIGHVFDGEELKTLFMAVVTSADRVCEELRRLSRGKYQENEAKQILDRLNALVDTLDEYYSD